MEMMVNYPVNRIGTLNYNIQGDLDSFGNSEYEIITIPVPRQQRSQVKARWQSAVQRSRRNYVVEVVDIGVQVRRR